MDSYRRGHFDDDFNLGRVTSWKNTVDGVEKDVVENAGPCSSYSSLSSARRCPDAQNGNIDSIRHLVDATWALLLDCADQCTKLRSDDR